MGKGTVIKLYAAAQVQIRRISRCQRLVLFARVGQVLDSWSGHAKPRHFSSCGMGLKSCWEAALHGAHQHAANCCISDGI